MNSIRNSFLAFTLAVSLFSCTVDPIISDESVDRTENNRTGLTFEELFTFESSGSHFLGLGMTVKSNENAIYIAHRQTVTNSTDERILKYDLDTDVLSEYSFDHSDQVNKELEVIGNDVYLVGGSVMNRYRSTVDFDPKSVPHERNLYRYGATSSYDNLYVIGGGNSQVESENGGDSIESNQILKYNTTLERFETEAIMPERKFFADASIIDEKMYIFGGTSSLSTHGTNDIYVYDMETGSINSSFEMPTNISHTFTSAIDDLIIVGGTKWFDEDGDDASFDDVDHFESYLGVFDTSVNEFYEFDLPFEDANRNALQQVGVIGDYLYVVYGDTQTQSDGLKHYTVFQSYIGEIK